MLRGIVKANQGHVFRHAQVHGPEQVERTQRNKIVRRENGIRQRVVRHELLGRLVAPTLAVRPVHNQSGVGGNAHLGQRVVIACNAVFGGGDGLGAGDHGYSPVAGLQKMKGHLARPTSAVAAHTVGCHAVHQPVNQHEGHATMREALQDFGALGGWRDNQTVNAPAEQQIEIPRFLRLVLVGVAQDHGVTGLHSGVLYPSRHRSPKGVGYVGEEQS